MITIDFTGTFKNIKNFIAEYNKPYRQTIEVKRGKPKANGMPSYRDDVANMLRKQHLQLMETLIKNYARQINDEQKLRGPLQYLPAMRTNNVLLAYQINNDSDANTLSDNPVCTTRTIINLMQRLKKAGFITKYRFRGSSNAYEINLKAELLAITKFGLPAIPVGEDDEILSDNEFYTRSKKGCKPNKINNYNGLQASPHSHPDINNENVNSDTYQQILTQNQTTEKTQKQGFSNEKAKKLLHKDKNNIFNKDNNISGVNVDKKSTLTDFYNFFKGNTPTQKRETAQIFEQPNKKTNVQEITSLQQNKKPPIAPPPFSAPKYVEKYANTLLNLMYATIFSKQQYHAQSQIDYAKQFIVDELSGLNETQTKAKFFQLEIRIMLAYNWLVKDENRYIPVPSTYLNPENSGGFIRTLIWHRNFIENKRNAKKIKEQLTHQTAQFYERWTVLNKAMDTYLKQNDYFAYQKAKNNAKKAYPEVANAFDMMVLRNKIGNKITQKVA